VILSDSSIKQAMAQGRIRIDPADAGMIQPASVDLRAGHQFRVFHNARKAFIDVKENQADLTELVEASADKPFILHPGEFVLGSTLEVVGLPDDLVARLEGKALALDTEVPTPSGWRAMGDLVPGDSVFGGDGQPTQVVAVTPPILDRPCREVIFSDGTSIVADAAHRWLIVDKGSDGRRKLALRTTDQIGVALSKRGEYNHQVPLAGPVRYPARQLPIDPYRLGVRVCNNGALGDDQIPELYLRADVSQRQALLEGLMDGAGCVDRAGRCKFSSADERLADQVFELVASLGLGPSCTKTSAGRYGIDHGPEYQVRFEADRPVFRLPRKLARQKPLNRVHRFRAIREVREILSVPVRCIEVGAPSGLFLVTRAHIPTHNSSLGRLGLLIHSTAGFVDPGFEGHLTLELSNVSTLPITIYPGMKIGQISFYQLTTPADRPYGSAGNKYHGQRGPTPSRFFEEF
jgi:deoxycytidine triphosphate deaminase